MGHHETIRKAQAGLGRFFKVSLLGFALSISGFGAVNAAELLVPIDETKVFVMDEAIATLAVSNPSIADVTVHNDKILLVIGKTYGSTNIIALNADGVPIATKRIRVVSPVGGANVTLVRANGIYSYSCAPRCERTIMPGDSTLSAGAEAPNSFREMSTQAETKSGQAAAASK